MKRPPEDLQIRFVGAPSAVQKAKDLLPFPYALDPRRSNPDVEILVLPGNHTFSGDADCNILLLLDEGASTARTARQAHLIVGQQRVPGLPTKHQFRLNELDRALNLVA